MLSCCAAKWRKPKKKGLRHMCQELLAGNPQEVFPGTFQEGGHGLSVVPCFSNVISMQVMSHVADVEGQTLFRVHLILKKFK